MLSNPISYGLPSQPFLGGGSLPQTNIFSAFNEELRTLTFPDSRRINALTQLAKECHN